ncbi:fungal-specific transcription factor domain-containing protein [Lipomyces kononenkoae]|uniref:Fungal-specific transcription factor domain-containing protein n=1 Tax=Lipomyces kononenkoae TaxID=34357 RepID=A0ACC3SYR6_LIPKO
MIGSWSSSQQHNEELQWLLDLPTPTQKMRWKTPLAKATSELIVLPQNRLPRDLATPISDLLKATQDIHNDGVEPYPEASTIQRGADCPLTSKESVAFGWSDSILLMFYLEHLLPFLFPFYRPSLLQGGRAWILEMMISSPVVRRATLCQSSYFFCLARGTANRDVVWETVLTQTRDAFGVLRQAMEVIDGSGITEHLHGAVRIMAGIMQVQRFEIALLDSPGAVEPTGPSSSFNAVISGLGPSSCILPAHCVQVPSAEQAAFRFSSALLIFDDVIASTVLQEQPRLYEYHRSLLGNIDRTDPPINLEAALGCQNWALLQIGEIVVLDAWKRRGKRAGNLDVMQLVHRATAIKDSLESHLTRLEPMLNQKHPPARALWLPLSGLMQPSFIYSSFVDVRYHVGRIVELLTCQISPPALQRTTVWPFCVAGCLAEPAQEAHFRGMVEALQPPSVFGTVRKALEIMDNVWRNRDSGDAASRDLATCFRSEGDLVLLI